jgi:CsoR family transcriptional regulator, copper-sensing transcriptional repressor
VGGPGSGTKPGAPPEEGRTVNHSSPEGRHTLDLLKTARGQVEGIIRMLEEDRYCIDVSKQILAALALLKKANLVILKQHMNTCVKDAFRTNKGSEKIDEIALILEKYVG